MVLENRKLRAWLLAIEELSLLTKDKKRKRN